MSHTSRARHFFAIAIAVALPCSNFAQDPALPAAKTDLYGDPLPAGAVARLGTIRFRHGSHWVKGLALTPDGATLIAASGDDDSTIYFWDAGTGRLTRKVSTSPLSIRGFAMSRDARQMAIAGFWFDEDRAEYQHQVWIIDTASGEKTHTLKRADRALDHYAMAFTPDGKLLVSLGMEGNLCIEEVATGVEILRQRVPRDNSPSLAISPDGTTIAASTGPNTHKFLLWKWQTGEEPQELKAFGNRGGSGQLTFSPDGRQVAACIERADFPIHIWDVETSRLLQRLNLPDGQGYLRGTVLFSPDGKHLLVPGWRRDSSRSVVVHDWDPTTGEYQGKIEAPAGGMLAISTDGRILASTSDAGMRVWKWPSREIVLPNQAAHQEAVSRVATAPNGTVITASDDGSIRVWDPNSSRQIRALRHDYWVRDIAVSPDGSKLVSSGLDDTVRLWDLESGHEIYRLPGHGRLGGTRAVAFSADGQSFGSFGDDCYLRVWDVRTGKALLEHKIRPTGVTIPEDNDDQRGIEFFHIDRATFSPDASLLTLSIGKLFVFRSDSGQELHTLENPGSHIVALAISPDARYLLASGWGKPRETKLADGRTRYSTEKSNPITLWDVGTGEVVKQLILPEGGAGPVAFSSDGSRFGVCSIRPANRISVYETASGAELQVIDEVPSRVGALCFGPGDKSIVAGLSDTTALVWDLSQLPPKR